MEKLNLYCAVLKYNQTMVKTRGGLIFYPLDMPYNHWAKPSVTGVLKTGLMSIHRDGNFYGNKAITRAELAATIHRFIKIMQGETPETTSFVQEYAGSPGYLETPHGITSVALTGKTNRKPVTFSLVNKSGRWIIKNHTWENDTPLEFQFKTKGGATKFLKLFIKKNKKRDVTLKTNISPDFIYGGFYDSPLKAFSFHSSKGIYTADYNSIFSYSDGVKIKNYFYLSILINASEFYVLTIPFVE